MHFFVWPQTFRAHFSSPPPGSPSRAAMTCEPLLKTGIQGRSQPPPPPVTHTTFRVPSFSIFLPCLFFLLYFVGSNKTLRSFFSGRYASRRCAIFAWKLGSGSSCEVFTSSRRLFYFLIIFLARLSQWASLVARIWWRDWVRGERGILGQHLLLCSLSFSLAPSRKKTRIK